MSQDNPPPYQDYSQENKELPPPYIPWNPQVVHQQPTPNLENPQPSYLQPTPYYPVEPQTVQPNTSRSAVRAPTAVVQVRVVGQKSINMTCPSCNSRILTEVETKPSKHAHRMSIVLCLLGCWLCCCCAPYCMDTCYDAHHKCPNCANIIGTHRC